MHAGEKGMMDATRTGKISINMGGNMRWMVSMSGIKRM